MQVSPGALSLPVPPGTHYYYYCVISLGEYGRVNDVEMVANCNACSAGAGTGTGTAGSSTFSPSAGTGFNGTGNGMGGSTTTGLGPTGNAFDAAAAAAPGLVPSAASLALAVLSFLT